MKLLNLNDKILIGGECPYSQSEAAGWWTGGMLAGAVYGGIIGAMGAAFILSVHAAVRGCK